jgi:DNA-binding transcriptional LysR family regulator
MFSLKQLKYYVTTVQEGNVNQAARHLELSQQGLTKQLGQLERELDCQLFVSRSSNIELTEAGKYFYERAHDIVEEAEQALRDLQEFIETHPEDLDVQHHE